MPSPISKPTPSILSKSPRRDAVLRGARELLPLSPGIFAWGLVTGVAMVKSGLSTLDATILSLLAYAGSAQLAAMPLIAALAPLWLVTLTAVIVNLRFVVYTALLRPHFTHLPAGRRLWLGYIVGDIMFVRFTTLLQQEPNYPHKVAYYTGGALANWVIWQVSSLIGIFAAAAIPASWGLELAGTLALVALLVPLCRQWPALAGAIAAAIVAVLANSLPLRLGLLCGVIAGIVVALVVERRSRHSGASGQDRS
ncbi:MAG: hypothetical protein RL321_1442 [Pseudomonadota bacterium]